MPFTQQAVDETAINTIRTLAADVVAGANSGHPDSSMRTPKARNGITAIALCFLMDMREYPVIGNDFDSGLNHRR
ncbi:hypothetical protein FS842_004694 [Serendipita sp. 407]|nr:hypothetical protein FRC18_010597 [Serendipita sp. 400]KAG9028811.1 hypothetical protein FS842_004694 [Serendipita sp. 407]